MSSSKGFVFGILEKEMRGRDVPLGVPKIYKHKFHVQIKLNNKLRKQI